MQKEMYKGRVFLHWDSDIVPYFYSAAEVITMFIVNTKRECAKETEGGESQYVNLVRIYVCSVS